MCPSVSLSLDLYISGYVSLFLPGSLIPFGSLLLFLCLPFCLFVPPSVCLYLSVYVSLSLWFGIAQAQCPRQGRLPASRSLAPGLPAEGLAPTHSPTFVLPSSRPSLGLNSMSLQSRGPVLLCVCCAHAHMCIHTTAHLSVCLSALVSPSLQVVLSHSFKCQPESPGYVMDQAPRALRRGTVL